MSLLPACVHIETRNALLESKLRTRIDYSIAMVLRSGVLNRLRRGAGLSYRQVDEIAVKACGRKWCMIQLAEEYDATISAILDEIKESFTEGKR